MIVKEFEEALEFMGLSPFVTFDEIKKRYLELSQKFHPDKGGDINDMQKLNKYYNFLKSYIENYRFTFSEEEVKKQYLDSDYVARFRF